LFELFLRHQQKLCKRFGPFYLFYRPNTILLPFLYPKKIQHSSQPLQTCHKAAVQPVQSFLPPPATSFLSNIKTKNVLVPIKKKHYTGCSTHKTCTHIFPAHQRVAVSVPFSKTIKKSIIFPD
jgi:hypothetical protein